MKFFKNIFRKKESNNTNVSIAIKMFGKEHIVDVDLSDEALKEWEVENEIMKKNAWIGKNRVEQIRDDGVSIRKDNRVTRVEEELIGFYGLKWYSENSEYCVVYLDGDEQEDGHIALVEVKSKDILFKNRVRRPHNCVVSNNGVVSCCDWKGWDDIGSIFWVFDRSGEVIFKQNYRQNFGDLCEINKEGTITAIDVLKSWEIHVIDISQQKIIKKVNKDWTIKTEVEVDNREIRLYYSDETIKVVHF